MGQAMTGTVNVPLDPRQADLVKELAAIRNSLSDFRQALRSVNDEVLNGAFREVLDSAERIVEEHAQRPGEHIADDIANLRSLFARRNIPREDPDLGKLPSLTALRSARGALLADFDSVLNEARSLGLVPTDPRSNLPANIEIERAGREGQLAALEQRLQKVEHLLETKIAPEGQRDEGRSLQQIGLVNFYVEAMKIELMLAMLETKARDLVDLAGLWRSIEAMGELTADFVATVQGLREKVTNTLKRGTQALRPSVRRVVGGLKTMVASVRREARRNAPRGYVAGDRFRDFDAAPEMIVVPAGEFMMGSREGEGYGTEHPQHKVTIARPFAVGRFAVTFDEWDAAHRRGGVRHNPRDAGWGRGRRPVINVSWDDAQIYVGWLSQETGKSYRLLSEAEWEYCCRAGTTTTCSFGDTIDEKQAQFSQRTVEVGSFPANAWGLHDMHGNVWEWCEDNWHENYRGNPPTDGAVWRGGDASLRVLRGGSWDIGPRLLRSADRFRVLPGIRDNYVGFRVARTL